MSVSSDHVRSIWTQSDDARDEGLTTPEDIKRFDDIAYGEDPMQVLDVYRPKELQGDLPVFVLVHGGGWVYGDKDRYQFYGMSMAQRGFAVINYSYRLAPEHKFPASLEDTCRVICWMLENAQAYGLDTEHVFLAGDSAGAHLAGLFTSLCVNPDYAQHFGFSAPEGFRPTAVALNCGIYAPADDIDDVLDMSLEERDQIPYFDRILPEFMEDLLEDPRSGKLRSLIRVQDWICAKWPPVYLMTAHGDYLMEAAPAIAQRLEEVGVPCTYVVYASEDDPAYHDYHINVQDPVGQKANDDEAAYFHSFTQAVDPG